MKNLKYTSLALLSTLIMTTQSSVSDVLTEVQLHATLGVVTNFILSDEVITHNGTSYKTVTSPYTGRVWLDRNLGADRACIAIDDTECYGDYYQWGRGFDGHQESNSSTTDTLATDVDNAVGHGDFIKNGTLPRDWASVDYGGAIRNENWLKSDGTSICPRGFRVPTQSELYVEVFNIPGSLSTYTRFDIYNDFLKLPSASVRFAHSALLSGSVGSAGYYWTATSSPSLGKSMFLSAKDLASQTYISTYQRGNGIAVRCIKEY